jgi:glycine dehydrogenase subunit 2
VAVTPEHELLLDLDDFKAKLSDSSAVFMITNPNTCGIFETEISL